MIFLVLAFIVVPILELFVIVQVAGGIGVLETIGLLILVSIVGAWLVRREGLGVMRRLQDRLEAMEMPSKEIVDGALILFGGALMLTPGFITDAVGLALLIPPVRAPVRALILRWVRVRGPGSAFRFVRFGGPGARYGGGGPVYDVTDLSDIADTTADSDDGVDPRRIDPPSG